ncbi:MAG TPA: MXAN_5808 family serine peptidase [Polyangiaceae bacterium LLY-WYZ-15_(1-7)]|nr:MXAN_5808 family serine peptidase [Polyangiaceae bacterium LLY-WYZ-15_(1-7)]HJL05288.1 MXAN_5808 family serine peptidase [Polyangiaceae bacterium LLY-WYZ-15_(1-7)]HJL07906.1 MXAN_5808 family serine peptidase [Polyangiaceae bacterium LLY-WYZ-15_(1-7)]HJL22702.1 MXAN_5808 family serine peptidase [Polyangiaceae bacterium LLY-WYZ-15_(1-7)]HJL37717.1 MXAN_5808 family serine peptidase [Polyangiaceae bacterium LLY-WYZ-15_(1-7)]
MPTIKRLWKPLLALAAVLAAFTITFVWNEPNGLDIDIDGSPRAQAARSQDPYDLTQLQVLNRAILEVNDHYVEPERIDHRRMLLAGLNAIQRSVAPVIVHYEDGAESLAVQVNDQRREFALDVNSPWSLARRFREIFGFLQDNLHDEEVDLRDIEYTAVNGMLRTLDPHTVLLTPDIFEEMQMSTRGEFGGLGIVISIREGHLTIIRPMPNTPASRAGLERGDRVVKINDESTLNMPLSEAVDRLRGPPGSRVTVFVRRRNGQGQWQNPQRVELVRAVIHIDSVESRMLDGGVGYISINSFQGNTHEDLRRALAELHRQDLQGLVLDLRDNPGGLLEQAVRISDTFLSSGTIVTTSSNDPRQREEKFASGEGTEPAYPMVVLLNGASASASEIVAGALKNHDRALVIGQRSFGKGSVQVLNNFQDGSALKLTIAQYLTPGDLSIQGVGIVPDIAIDPMTVDAEDMDLAVDPEAYLREADLRSALTSDRVRERVRPSEVLRYYLNREMRQQLREQDPRDNENEEEDEFLLRFSRQLLTRVRASDRREMLEQAQPVLAEVRAEEMNRAIADLRRLGVDWSEGPDGGPSPVRVEVSTNRPDNVGRAGEPFSVRVRVTNEGDAPLFRLRGTTKSDYRLFDDRELVFGRLNPGETKEWTTTLGTCTTENDERVCRLPRDTPDRADGIKIEFDELHGHAPEPAELRTRVEALPRPQFAYYVQVADDIEGNGDGRLQRGEHASLYLRVRNVGRGRTFDTHANLRNLSGRGILLRDGRFRIDDIAPGEERLVRFTFEVLEDFERDETKLELSVIDADLRESISEKVIVPILPGGSTPAARSGRVTLSPGAVVRAAPDAEAEILAEVEGGGLSLPAEATLDGFVRVRLGEEQVAWVAESQLGNGQGGSLEFQLNHAPPRIEVDYGGTLVTRENSITLRGTAVDETLVRDLYIFAGARKVHYRSTRRADDRTRVSFETEIPMHGGINYITVFARESDEIVSRRLIVVRRDAPDGSLMETPRFDDDVFGNVHYE